MRRRIVLLALAAVLAAAAVAVASGYVAGRYTGHATNHKAVSFGVSHEHGADHVFNFHYDHHVYFRDVKVRDGHFAWQSEDYEGSISIHGHFSGTGTVKGTFHAIGHDPVHFTAHHHNEVLR